MDPSIKPKERNYVVLMIMDVKKKWFELSKKERAELTKPHVKELGQHLEKVSLTSLQGTGLSKHTMIEILESKDLYAIEAMIEEFKASSKAKFGVVRDILIMEKGIERLR